MSHPKRAGRVCMALAVVLTAGSLAACSDGYKPKPLSENAVSLTAALNADAKAKEEGVAASFTEKNIVPFRRRTRSFRRCLWPSLCQ